MGMEGIEPSFQASQSCVFSVTPHSRNRTQNQAVKTKTATEKILGGGSFRLRLKLFKQQVPFVRKNEHQNDAKPEPRIFQIDLYAHWRPYFQNRARQRGVM